MEQVSESRRKLERKIQTEYKKAYAEIKKKFLADKKELTDKDAEMLAKLQAGKIKQSEYDRWRTRLENRLKRDVRKMTIILNGADQFAVDVTNDVIPKEYADGVNEETYQIEKDLSIDTNFTLVDKDAVIDAVEGEFMADIDYDRNTKWNQRRISSAITQGIIAGDSIPAIAKRLLPLVNSNEASAMRNARTWTHAARSGGQQQAAERAVAQGVMIDKWWQAVTDLKTRISHRQLHGERREATEPFSNGGMYPADPSLPPAERYNCRCRMLYLHKGLTPDFIGDHKDIHGMTEEEWRAGKDKKKKLGAKDKKRSKQADNSTKYTDKLLKSMSRSDLIKVALDVFVKQNKSLGEAEAIRRFYLLEGGNTDAQLRKYIKKRRK